MLVVSVPVAGNGVAAGRDAVVGVAGVVGSGGSVGTVDVVGVTGSAATTTPALCAPAIAELPESTAETLCVPTVWKMTVKVPTPLVSVESTGSSAVGSSEVKWTTPL